jgi:hypothetical protein
MLGLRIVCGLLASARVRGYRPLRNAIATMDRMTFLKL